MVYRQDKNSPKRNEARLAATMLMLAVPLAWKAPYLAVVLAGLGNAAFHVGAGAMVLRLSPNRAAAAGLFVAPGAIGLAIGHWCGTSFRYWPLIGLPLLFVGAAVIWGLGNTTSGGVRASSRTAPIERKVVVVCILALLVCIATRSLGGLLVGSIHYDARPVLWGLGDCRMCREGIWWNCLRSPGMDQDKCSGFAVLAAAARSLHPGWDAGSAWHASLSNDNAGDANGSLSRAS